MPSTRAVLIYDADCPACRGSVEWVRRRAPSPRPFEFLPCRSRETRERFPSVGEADCLRAVQLVLPDGTILAGEKAIPEILRRLPRWRLLAALFSLPGSAFLSRLLYRFFAAHRLRISDVASRTGR